MERKEQMKETIATKLKRYRLEHDLTFEEIAEKAGVGAPTVYRIENGLVEPNERTLYKLGKALPGLLESAA
jgi:transcriptional regulator with XRE-family HTH domain